MRGSSLVADPASFDHRRDQRRRREGRAAASREFSGYAGSTSARSASARLAAAPPKRRCRVRSPLEVSALAPPLASAQFARTLRRLPPDAATPPRAPTSAPRAAKIALVALAIALVVAAQRFGVFAQLSEPATAAHTLVAMGAWGYVAFILAYALLQPFGIPGTVFVLAAPLIWPWPTAFALSMTGTMAASVVGFSFARFVARDWIAERIPERFRKHEQALASRGFATVFTLRLVFWMPPLLHAFFGVSRVRFWTHFWGSLAGYIVPLLAMSYFGQRVFDVLRTAPRETWIATGAAIVVVAVGAWALRRQRATLES